MASTLREQRIPCDVLHLDTAWFEHDWQCDWQFSATRFPDPEGMIRDLHEQGYRVSLWQLPYVWQTSTHFAELRDRDLLVRSPSGRAQNGFSVIDMSNPAAVDWYRARLSELKSLGVDAVKTDFGESAPADGEYHSGASGALEHNRFPVRYGEAAWRVFGSDGDSVLWSRSAWAGSQRYPVHWGGDTETSDVGMLRSLYGALSLGMSGFTYWSCDIGGFTAAPDEELYRRWLPYGLLLSHSRCHGKPPREPWHYSESFVDYFRTVARLRYRLLPYIAAEAHASALSGQPFARPLCLEYPEDALSWRVDDQFLAGSSLLVAPFFKAGESSRSVYLPPGRWTDLFTGNAHQGPVAITYEHREIPVGLFVRGGRFIPISREVEVATVADVDLYRPDVLCGEGPCEGLVYRDIGQAPVQLQLTADTLSAGSGWPESERIIVRRIDHIRTGSD